MAQAFFRYSWKRDAGLLKGTGADHVGDNPVLTPESTAVRVALWRALHVQLDPPPHVLADEVGLALVEPGDGWQGRPDMDPGATRRIRASMVARARLLEDLLAEQVARGVGQYVVLGAGLDTFAQRRVDLAAGLRVFEVDQPGPQEWKRQRLVAGGFGVPPWLRLVAVDLEADGDWWPRLVSAGFDPTRPAVVAATGVSQYLTKSATAATLRHSAVLAAGSTLVATFMLPEELIEAQERPGHARARASAQAAGTPFLSFFTPTQFQDLARGCGFATTRHVSAADLAERYFTGRPDALRPSSVEDLIVATV